MKTTLAQVREDWCLLDDPELELPSGTRILSHERFVHRPDLPVDFVPETAWSRLCARITILHEFARALQLIRAGGESTVLLVDGRTFIWMFCGIMNRFLTRKRRRILVWGLMVEVEEAWKRRVYRAAIQGIDLAPLWSRLQVQRHSDFLEAPASKFMFLPYKANHSQGPRYELPIHNYVFSGGNGKRDYRALVDAVRGTGIPLIISATRPSVRDEIEFLPNVIVLAAREPAFAQLQAGARFTVVVMRDTGLKGGGEANMCNGMWHGKPVIAMDRVSAPDYISDGDTGYVVAPGDVEELRRRIVELWNNPGQCREMGERAQRYVEQNLTHELFIQRLLRLALLCAT